MNIISENFEMRFISSDVNANGETDFKGETSTLTTEQRIAYLNAYAKKIPDYADDFSLDVPAVSLEAAKERLKQIKSPPEPEFRNRMNLDGWKWIGYRPFPDQPADNGHACLLHTNSAETVFAVQDWRCFLEWELDGDSGYENCEFSFSGAAVAGFDGRNRMYYISGFQKVFLGDAAQVHKLKIELDFVCRKWNLYLNDRLSADFVDFSDPAVGEGNRFTLSGASNPHSGICKIRGVGYHPQPENALEPFTIETFIDSEPAHAVGMENWNQEGCDDGGWQSGVLPIVHGGERYAGQDIYMRRTVVLDEIPSYAELYLESLTPGGEVYINGRLAAFIQDECCHKIDVTDYVRKGRNLLAVRVYADQVKACDKMTHTHTDRHTGWFAGRMHLDLLPEIYIEDLFSWTEVIQGGTAQQKIQVSVKARRAMASAKAVPHTVSVRMTPWFPEEGTPCAGAEWTAAVTPNLTEVSEGKLIIQNPELWTPGNPRLYKITAELKNPSGDTVDDFVITTGIRTVGQEGGIFRINGTPELLRAPLLFGARPPLDKLAAWDRCPPAEFYIQEMLAVKKMNGNGLRMSVHDKRTGGCSDPRVCELADQLGIMLVWQTSAWLRVTSATNLCLTDLAASVRQVRNHCSIVIWQPSNHPSWRDWETVMRVYHMIYDTITPLDPSRLISPSADSRRMRPRWDDGLTDFYGNPCETCDPIWTAPNICRGNMDYILGYGNEWSALRQWPAVEKKNLPDYMDSTDYIPSYINSPERAYFNFEHDEIIGQPNWNLHKGKPTYHIDSYEKYYEEGSIGRALSFDEWQTSQAWQALGAYETICKCRWLGYDGLCWCNLRGGLNTGTYQKSLLDYYGQPKLAFYAHRLAFQDVLACSGNVDMVYGPDDAVPVIVLNIGRAKEVTVRAEVISEDGTTVFCRNFEHVELPESRSVTPAADIKLPELPDGIYTVQYTVYQ